MKPKPASPNFPWLLLAGVVAGFAGAVVAGRQATSYSKPSHFVRFHQRISPEASFYPPFSMLENLALARSRPGRTVVIIGGNSILNGVGQPEAELWSLRLQEMLGDRYAVVNLSFRGANPAHGAALVAESLVRRNLPVIYVANTAPGTIGRADEGPYGYLYWDAFYKHRLLPDPDRDALTAAAPPNARRFGMWLDAGLRFEELWHHVAYRHFSTVWTPLTRAAPFAPRDRFRDDEPAPPPVTARFQRNFAAEMEIVRGFSRLLAEPDGQGRWIPAEGPMRDTTMEIESIFPEALRPHMLIVLDQNCPVYRRQLTPAERARDELVFSTYESLWRRSGVACLTAGLDFQPEDFLDRTHLTPSGGRKLAALVAEQIRRLSP